MMRSDILALSMAFCLLAAPTGCKKHHSKTQPAPTASGAPGASDAPAARDAPCAPAASSKMSIPSALAQRLPEATGDTLIAGLIVQVSSKEIRLGHRVIAPVIEGRIPAAHKRDGAEGFFISALFNAAKESRLRRGATKEGTGRHCAVIAADRDVSYRLVAEVLYTLNQAESPCIQLAALSTGGTQSRVVGLPITMPRLSPLTEDGESAGRWKSDEWGNRYWDEEEWGLTAVIPKSPAATPTTEGPAGGAAVIPKSPAAKPTTEDPSGGSAVVPLGIAQCDEYQRIYRCYIGKLPAASKEVPENSLNQMVYGWKKAIDSAMDVGAAKKDIAKGCQMAIDAFKRALGENPMVKDCL